MKELLIIRAALTKNPEGIRCCVASPDPVYKAFNRGTTGTLHPIGTMLQFVPDDRRGTWNFINFNWTRWPGLHIPSINIIRS